MSVFKKEERGKNKRFISIVAVIVIAILATSIRVYPAAAVAFSKVPGLEYIVKLINYDKGIKDIVDNDFVQPVNLSEKHEDIIFTIKDIIIDNSKCIVFYSIENKGNHRFVNLHEMKFTDESGKELIASEGWIGYIDRDMNIEKKLEGNVELNFTEETIIPDKLFITVKLQESNDTRGKQNILSSTWKFEIPIDKGKFETMHKVYNIDEKVEIEGQKIYFKTLTITPTRIALLVEYDKNNTKKILGFNDLSIFNKNGEEWARISNGVTSIIKNEYEDILYFQSNYFTNSKEIYIKGSSIRALDKDKLTVVVDTDKKKIIKGADYRLRFDSIDNNNVNDLESLKFILTKTGVMNAKNNYNVFKRSFKDSNGKAYDIKSIGIGNDGTNEQTIFYNIPKGTIYKNPIYLTIEDYPAEIKGEFEIKVIF